MMKCPAYDKPLDKPLQLYVVVQLTNTGKEKLAALCRKDRGHYLESNHSNPAFDGFVVYRVSDGVGLRGLRVIPSFAELSSVVLDPGETTEFRCPVRVPPDNTLEKIQFRYRIDADIAGRFGAWSGEVEAPIMRQRMGYPPSK